MVHALDELPERETDNVPYSTLLLILLFIVL